jgi:methylmalonyl-CoA mutase, N-terminal domain
MSVQSEAGTEGGEGELELLYIDPALERKQIDPVQAVRGGRDSEAVERALGELREAPPATRT